MAQEKDIVLIYMEDNPVGFARIEDIQADAKPDWYHVDLLLLQIPPQPVTWILRNAYINGDEFTMNGTRMRLELVESPAATETKDAEPREESSEPDAEDEEAPKGKVISLAGRKKD
ncbi:MAG: hypothetical protein ACLFRG_07420 [Desulfococcaceae bacterium]